MYIDDKPVIGRPEPTEADMRHNQALLRRLTREAKYSPQGMRRMNALKGVGRPPAKERRLDPDE